MKKLFLILMIFAISTTLMAQDWNEEVPYGTEYTVTASPNEGWEFVGWYEDGVLVSSELNYTFIVTTNRNLVAEFQRLNFIIQIQVNPTGAGSVEGAGVQPAGSEVILRATPFDDYEFRNFTDKLTGQQIADNPYSFIADRDRDMSANFASTGPPSNMGWLTWLILGIIFVVAFILGIQKKPEDA